VQRNVLRDLFLWHGRRKHLAALQRIKKNSAWKWVMVVLSEGCKSGPSLCTSSATIIRFHSLACCQELLALTRDFLNESVASAMNMDKFKYADHILLVYWALLDLTNTVCLEQKRVLVWIFLVVEKSHHPSHSVWQRRNELLSGHWHVSLCWGFAS
jgi:hypothetical protein